jgi:hypothetical protein
MPRPRAASWRKRVRPGATGAFTKALLEGLAGAADFDKDGFVDTDELGLWVRKRVSAITEGAQEPIALKSQPVPDYTVASTKKIAKAASGGSVEQ